jgi:crotonobetainyl-CoA:carnitine CoA-transferase CaiB-like acyl-CoA transferase
MYNIYETADGKYIVLGASELHFARNVLAKMNRLDLLPLCEPPPGPTQQPVKEFFTATFRSRTQAEWIAWFADVDAAFAPVNDLRQGVDDPQVRAREMIVTDAAGNEHIGVAIKFRNEPGRIDPRPPGLGEHNEQLAREVGFSAAEISAMRAQGAFG